MTVFGLDPSFGGFGISDGVRHDVFKTAPGTPLDERIDLLVQSIDRFIFDGQAAPPMKQLWVIEAPMLAAGKGGVGHLFEIGNLMRAIRSEYASEIRALGVELIYLEVQIGTLRHFTTGCGNMPKELLAYAVEAIHGKTFERDRGLDKLVAWSLVQYGRAMLAGQVEHRFAAARGSGEDEVARRRAVSRRAVRSSVAR